MKVFERTLSSRQTERVGSKLYTASVYDYRKALAKELLRRRQRNPRYSLRAFARDLIVPASMLSEILNRRAGLSHATALRLINKIELPKEEVGAFLNSVILHHARDEQKRTDALMALRHQKLHEDGTGIDLFDPDNLNGVWRASVRVSSSGIAPKLWNPKTDYTYFLFNSSRMEYASRGPKNGQFHIYGKWEMDHGRLFTPTTHFDCWSRPKELCEPWLGGVHKIVALGRDRFSLSTSNEFLKTDICPAGDSLETVWTRVM